MMKYLITFLLSFLFSCKGVFVAENKTNHNLNVEDYSGAYYKTFTIFPEKGHPMIMGGVGDSFDLSKLDRSNLQNFMESFYVQLAYFPALFNDFDYRIYANCLGYEITWDEELPYVPLYSNFIEDDRIILEDGEYIVIRNYRILGSLDVGYPKVFKECIGSSSIEFDISTIKSINRVAVLIDKKRVAVENSKKVENSLYYSQH